MTKRIALSLAAFGFLAAFSAAQLVNGSEAAAQSARETTVDQMSPGNARAYTTAIQEELAALGYHPGPADGIEGPQTRAAIRSYQRNSGLTVTGRASKELLDYMKFVQPKSPAKAPAADPMVLEVQRALAERGYYQDKLDGIIGPATRGAIGAYQSDNGMAVDGRISPELMEQLRQAQPEGSGTGIKWNSPRQT